jgi:fumarylacetoacetase
VISRSNAKYLYWSFAQQIAHHTVNGCIIQSGDLMASGTISGNEPGSYGSMLELTWNGSKPITLANGDTRAFLEDGDTLILRGWSSGGTRIGFGECRATLLPSKPWSK